MKELIWFGVGIGFGIYIMKNKQRQKDLEEELIRKRGADKK